MKQREIVILRRRNPDDFGIPLTAAALFMVLSKTVDNGIAMRLESHIHVPLKMRPSLKLVLIIDLYT